MGETAQLRNPLAGTFGFNDFISQGDSEATILNLLRTMVPTVDMRDFQRRYLFDTGSQSVFVGDRISLLRWTVPAGEFWRPLSLLYQNADSSNHEVIVAFSMAKSPAALVYQPARMFVPGNSTKIVYGSNQDGSISNGFEILYSSLIPVTMEPGDDFDLIDNTSAAGAATMRWIFVYELVPAPVTARTSGVDAVVTVVP